MKIEKVAIGLTVINLALLLFLLSQTYKSQANEVAPVLRGRALQIVDAQDRTRAEIVVNAPETVNGKAYPETVLFRMFTAQRAPLVKLTVSEDGSAFRLSDDSDSGAVEQYANRNKGNFVKVVNRNGREQLLKP